MPAVHPAPLDPAQPDPAPANRAARRGKARKPDPEAVRYRGSGGPAGSMAQGRRINPVRRTG